MGTVTLKNILFELDQLDLLSEISIRIQIIHQGELRKTNAVLTEILPAGALLESSLALNIGQEIGLLININSRVTDELMRLDLIRLTGPGRIEAKAIVQEIVSMDETGGKCKANISLPGKFRITG